jgi:hypothetical protein
VRRDAQCAGGDDVDVGLGQFSGRGWRLTVQVDGNGMIVFHERHTEREREEYESLLVFDMRAGRCWVGPSFIDSAEGIIEPRFTKR